MGCVLWVVSTALCLMGRVYQLCLPSCETGSAEGYRDLMTPQVQIMTDNVHVAYAAIP